MSDRELVMCLMYHCDLSLAGISVFFDTIIIILNEKLHYPFVLATS